MEELFGVPMDIIMVVLLAIFLPVIAIVAVVAWRNPVMLKLGLRNVPRRKSQTALIIVGMYLMTGLWKGMFAKYGGNYKIRKENDRSDDTPKDSIGGTGDPVDGSDEGSQLPP